MKLRELLSLKVYPFILSTVGNHVLFQTYIRTERRRIFVSISLKHNEFLYGKAQMPRRFFFFEQIVISESFSWTLYFSTQPRAKTFCLCSRLCRKRKRITLNTSTFVCCLQKHGICTLPHESLLSIKEVMTNCLTRSVRIQIQKKNKSRDFSPC